jgi:acyl dehydratase
MAVSNKHVLHQGPVLATLARAGWAALRQQLGRAPASEVPSLPTPEIVETIPPRPADLVRDYVRHVGGDPSAYRGTIPAHMFPQWGFPLAARTLVGLPYPLVRVLNGGCRIDIAGPLPLGEPLTVRASLQSIDDNGRRAVLEQRVVTGTAAEPDLVVAHLYAIVPVEHAEAGKNGKSNGKGNGAAAKRDGARVPAGAEELARWRIPASAGLDFAKLTGDFNPVHWVRPYAKAFGFRSTILHGFATMARAIEGLQRTVFAGSTRALRSVDVKFTRPLVLPAKVGLYLAGREIFVGDAPGGPAYLTGSFATATEAKS